MFQILLYSNQQEELAECKGTHRRAVSFGGTDKHTWANRAARAKEDNLVFLAESAEEAFVWRYLINKFVTAINS